MEARLYRASAFNGMPMVFAHGGEPLFGSRTSAWDLRAAVERVVHEQGLSGALGSSSLLDGIVDLYRAEISRNADPAWSGSSGCSEAEYSRLHPIGRIPDGGDDGEREIGKPAPKSVPAPAPYPEPGTEHGALPRPYLFNPGQAARPRWFSTLEMDGGMIRLVRWMKRRHIQSWHRSNAMAILDGLVPSLAAIRVAERSVASMFLEVHPPARVGL